MASGSLAKRPEGLSPLAAQIFDVLARYTAFPWPVLMTQCDAEYLNWFLARAALRYTLESSKDYPTGAVKPSDCTVDQAKGVTSADIATRFGIK